LLATQASAPTCYLNLGLSRCWSRGQGRVFACPSFSAARAAENDIRDFLNFYCVRLRECGQLLTDGRQLTGVGGDGWRAMASHLRMLTVTRATHPALALNDDC